MYLFIRMNHLVSTKQFDIDYLNMFFERAWDMKHVIGKMCKRLRGKIVGLVFFEPSTRTMASFQAAAQNMGGSVININDVYSSTKKGESLEDTIRTMCSYCDAIVLRHPLIGSSARAVNVATKPIINGGDGAGEHPTQALLDMFTISEELGRYNRTISDGITVVFVGDLKHSRTIHSLIDLLCLYPGVKFIYVCPNGLEMPDEIVNAVRDRGINQVFGLTLSEAIVDADVLYVTRIQRERFENISDYESVVGSYVVDARLMSLAKEKMMVMHPLPRTGEIAVEVDSDPRCAYFKQMENGVFMRMAILDILLES